MCGIAGIATADGHLPDGARQIEAMIAAIAHRGPDGAGTWVEGGVALGQRRLSIIDLSDNGRQPMASADGTLQLLCNGEIYNYPELRRDEAAGYPYRSGTDVEVILPLYQRHGAGALVHLVGMFAIAIWDAPKRTLLLARDRIGEKPLYYAERDGKLAFASEIKALLTLPWVDRSVDEEAVTHSFAYMALPPPYTIYRGIRQLAPGELLRWHAGGSRRETWWRLAFGQSPRSCTLAEATATYGTLMRRAVKGQLLADVPIAVMLSGGVDSTTIARLTREQDAEVRTFCIGSSGPGHTDIEHTRAAEAAAILGTRHQNVSFGAFTPTDTVRVLAHYDQPHASLVTLYADQLAQIMRREVKVVLTGNGADEVLAGYAAYPRLGPLDLVRRGLTPIAPRAARLWSGSGEPRLRQLVTAAASGVAVWRGTALTASARALMAKLTTDAFAQRWRGAEPGRVAEAAVRESGARTLLEAATVADLMVCHQHGHAIMGDMAGMAHGLEQRAPFLDHRVVEFAAALPEALRVGRLGRAADAKLIARHHLREVMPASLVDARKIGFGYGIPLDRLLRRDWRPAIEGLLTGGRYLELGIFSRAGARWALDHDYFATSILLAFAVFAEVHLFGVAPQELGARLERALAGAEAP